MTRILILLFLLILWSTKTFSQKEGNLFFAKAKIAEAKQSGAFLIQNGLTLNLSKKESYKLSLKYLRKVYGFRNIAKQRPHKMVKVDNLWVIYGTLHKHKKGGVFYIIINSQNGAVEYCSHGK